MSDSKELLSCFNKKISEFGRDLASLYPSDTDILSFKTTLACMMLVDERKSERLFHSYVVVPYGDRLLRRDESFFLHSKEIDEVVDSHTEFPEMTQALLNKLRQYWSQMSEEDKTAVWNYFKVLSMLSRKLHA
jgi:hypothetical protein